MILSIKEIALLLDGEIIGDETVKINNIEKIEFANKGDITFFSNSKYEKYLYTSNASAVILDSKFTLEKKINPTIVIVDDAYLALSKIIQKFDINIFSKSGISKKSDVGSNNSFGENIFIGPFTSIGDNVKIGRNVKIMNNCSISDNVEILDNTIIHSSVNIYHSTKIGKNNIIHSGAVIGADGFGFAPNNDSFNKINQIGNVITGDHVEIGANTTIDRATIGSTIINSGVKIDNLVQVGHNVFIDSNTVIAGLTAIAGSTSIGKNCMIGGQCAIAGHLKIGNNVKVAGNSGVGSNIKDNKTVQGIFAFNKLDFQRSYVLFKNLPKLSKKIDDILNISK